MMLVGIVLMCTYVEGKRNPCEQPRPSGWRVYSDEVHQFYFSYPSQYRPVLQPKPMCRGPKLEDKETRANIGVCVLPEDFNDANLIKMAPTGIESPPDLVKLGEYQFYYFGPGGGRVAYPDGWYFNLRGKVLIIDFDERLTKMTKRLLTK